MRFCNLVSPFLLLEGKMVGRFSGDSAGAGKKETCTSSNNVANSGTSINYTEPYQKIALQKDGGNYIAEP